MSLPKLSTPSFFFDMPSTGKRHKYRPYLVEEQKIMLIALEGGSKEELISSISDIINICVEGVEAEKMSYFDFMVTYLKLYISSNGEAVSFKLPHIKETECNAAINVEVNLSDVQITYDPNHKTKFDITPEIGVMMRYPTAMELIASLELMKSNLAETNQHLIKSCIEAIYDADQIYKLEDFSQEEFDKWFQTLGKTHIKKIQEFFSTMPRVSIKLNYTCPKCGETESYEITDISYFFSSP